MSDPALNDIRFDSLMPAEMAAKAEAAGVKKSQLSADKTLVLAVLAGAFIALGAAFSTTVAAGGAAWPFGVVRLLAGISFSLGLMLVVVGGAELFTGNNLLVMAWASGKISTLALLRNWGLVFFGNLAGALLTALVVFGSGQYAFGNGVVGAAALRIAAAKCELAFVPAVCLGMLCNALVCMAVWLSLSCRTTTDRLLTVIWPIAAFVACGFEHSVANMYFIPLGLLIKNGAGESFWQAANLTPDALAPLTWSGFLLGNLLPVTLGNIVGGTVMVGAVYWFVYLRRPA